MLLFWPNQQDQLTLEDSSLATAMWRGHCLSDGVIQILYWVCVHLEDPSPSQRGDELSQGRRCKPCVYVPCNIMRGDSIS
ncbi:hypothetical protein J4Q44_G00177180 [Coregonus suidteri]|uniref:Uncharacterized protein n=1 Tax=Coregonus suidteri TaxID=861788 RepID=A0AAN8LM41_9TELE